jgi:AraC family transcriptional regulator of adaptative response/methylated-DNA-[protein]-cysteine methyltransferase
MLLPHDDDALYAALIARDPAYDGFYFVGVRTTGVFCRLTCPARKPKRSNSSFFASAGAAQDAGFRACLRCRPLEPQPVRSDAVVRLGAQVRAAPRRRWTSADIEALGYDASSTRRAFKRAYGMTFTQFARSQRLGAAIDALRDGASVIEAQLDAGYESGSGFREAVTRLLGKPPMRSRHRSGDRVLAARWLDTPIGAMLSVAGGGGVHLLEFAERAALPREIDRLRRRVGPISFGTCATIERLSDSLARYFAGEVGSFDVPVVLHGTPFERLVWAALGQVPPGETRSYAAIAAAVARPDAVRAAARANGANQLAIVIPCHRIVATDGALTGYGGKLWRKKWLLEHERRHTPAMKRN